MWRSSACGHASPRTSESEGEHRRQFALGVPASAKASAGPPKRMTRERAKAGGPQRLWKKGTLMLKEIKQGIRFTVVTMVLLGGGYHVVLWAIGQVAFPAQAEGSLIRRADGTIVGSRLIAQKFARPEYFHPRPSGVDYNAASTGGTNFGPSNADHLTAVRERLEAIEKREGVTAGQVPSEMVTASGGGMDPHIPPNAAELQAPRVASSRNVNVSRIRDLIAAHTEPPTFGFLGRARVNVLELNLALDEALGAPTPAPAPVDSK